MSQKINASVGKNGVNRKPDALVVQLHLSNWRAAPALLNRLIVPVSGFCDPVTIAAITIFQNVIMGFSRPDGRVDPEGQTFKRLIGPITAVPAKNSVPGYTSKAALRERALQAIGRGDRYIRSIEVLSVQFSDDFDALAFRVADQLRHKIVYRSDGGRIARGLVRASGDLELIHDSWKKAKLNNGDAVKLRAHLWRRKDPVAENRWVMSIRFWPISSSVNEDEGNDIVVDPNEVKKRLCTAAESVIGDAALVAADIPGEPGKRIRKMIQLADSLGCLNATEELWYYNRAVAVEYFKVETTDAQRIAMTSATGGRMPFDGDVLRLGKWRLFPFRMLAGKHGARGLSDAELKILLLDIDFAIFKTFDEIERESEDYGRLIAQGVQVQLGLTKPFIEHLQKLQKSSLHLYSAYK